LSEEEDNKKQEEIRRIREEHKRLSERIVLGTAHHETVKVLGMDGQEHDVEVRPVNDKEFVAACAAAEIRLQPGTTSMDLGSNMKLLAALAAVVTGDPKITTVLAPFQSAKIGQKVLELSDLTGAPKPDSTSS
jgi:hypothetical protein